MHLVDCGYGALAGTDTRQPNYRDVATCFLTHLHDDHTADLASLMGHQWTGGRVTPTDIYGPVGTRAWWTGALQFNRVSEEIRLVDEARSARMANLFRAHEIKASATPVVAFATRTDGQRSGEHALPRGISPAHAAPLPVPAL